MTENSTAAAGCGIGAVYFQIFSVGRAEVNRVADDDYGDVRLKTIATVGINR